ncbi:MAG: thioredoxin family protein [Candidatus Gastranaerophilales bacterium]|nr:thioredoxin family protein [Candidatus Gastranaerophilales bacterium]
MNKNTIILILIFVLPLIAYFCISHSSESNITVSSTVKPQIIKFTSNMCGECKRMDSVVKDIYPKYQDKIQMVSVPVQIQNDYNNQMVSTYKVTLVPTIILLDKNQKIVKRIEGYMDAQTFDKYLRELSND